MGWKGVHGNTGEREQSGRQHRRRLIERVCEIAEKQLPAGKKLLFLLYFRHGYKQKEIAELMGICVGSVSRRLERIGEELARCEGEVA